MIPTQLDGLLLVDKPKGCTSHDVVDFIRRRFQQKKVGHCGTLDPLATGLLLIVLGKATKVQDLLMAEDKEYRSTMKLGETTDSQDADGKIIETKPVPSLSRAELEAVFNRFTGDFYQTPPMVSALKRDGVPLYKLARQGKTVERQPRLVHVYSYEILRVELPQIEFHIKCSKGFYVRTYCHDIGHILNCGAHLIQLARTRSGNFSLDSAIRWEELEASATPDFLVQRILALPEISRIRRQ
ncbi:MAG: tRNA pseudouridine(55) synthase TruB [bacterium]